MTDAERRLIQMTIKQEKKGVLFILNIIIQ